MLEDILRNRGLSDEDLKVPSGLPEYEIKYMKNAVQMFINSCMNSDTFGVLFDPDVDGLSAGKLITEFIKKLGYVPHYTMNGNKLHGLNENIVEWALKNKIKCLMVVDGGTNDIKYQKMLAEKGVSVIVLDHHEFEEDIDSNITNKIAIVNVSYEGSPNRYLSGTGVTYRFMREVNKILKTGSLDVYEAWVGLSVLSDSCSLLNKENRYYVSKLIENRENIELFNMFKFYGNPTNHFIYSVIPALNACIRTGNEELAINIVLNNHPKELIKMVGEAKECVELQNTIIKDVLVSAEISESENVVITKMVRPWIFPTFTGLVASRIMDDKKKPCIVVYEHSEGYLKGSFRGASHDYKNIYNAMGIDARGHQCAFGIKIEGDREASISKIINNSPPIDESSLWDTEIDDRQFLLKESHFHDIALFNMMAGIGLEPVRIRINLTRNQVIKTVNGKKVNYQFAYFEALTFDPKEVGNYVVVTPSLSRAGYDLIM